MSNLVKTSLKEKYSPTKNQEANLQANKNKKFYL